MFGISEIAIILIIVVVVLGAKKLPELARSAGKSARILKKEAKAMKAESRSGGGQAPTRTLYAVSDRPAEDGDLRQSDRDGGGGRTDTPGG